MKVYQFFSSSFLILFSLAIFQMCIPAESNKTVVTYINSFHRGHPSSDDIMYGILENFPTDSFDIDTYFMDTKRNPSKEHILARADQLFDTILSKNPDILLISDDNAIKYIVKPHLDQLDMPVVFCGINWTDAEYDLPLEKVTGMLEILPVADMVLTMKSYYPEMSKLLFLSENTTTSRKEKQLLDTLFDRVGVEVDHELVDDFDGWKHVFKEANDLYDIIYLPTNGAIKGWDRNEAVSFITQYIKVPVVTTEDFMMPYCVFGLTKVAKEQGVWVALTAKKILRGRDITDFKVTRNKESTYWINTNLAERIGFKPGQELIEKSELVTD